METLYEGAVLIADDGRTVTDPAEIAAGIERAAAERQTLVARGLERARAFRWERIAARTVDVYREAVA